MVICHRLLHSQYLLCFSLCHVVVSLLFLLLLLVVVVVCIGTDSFVNQPNFHFWLWEGCQDSTHTFLLFVLPRQPNEAIRLGFQFVVVVCVFDGDQHRFISRNSWHSGRSCAASRRRVSTPSRPLRPTCRPSSNASLKKLGRCAIVQ